MDLFLRKIGEFCEPKVDARTFRSLAEGKSKGLKSILREIKKKKNEDENEDVHRWNEFDAIIPDLVISTE